MPGSIPARSTGSPPTATIAARRRGWPRRWARANCARRRCNGVAAAVDAARRFAMRVQRYMHEHGVRQEALRAIALASYHHEVGQFRNGLRQVVVSTPDCASGALRFPHVDAPAVGEDCYLLYTSDT